MQVSGSSFLQRAFLIKVPKKIGAGEKNCFRQKVKSIKKFECLHDLDWGH